MWRRLGAVACLLLEVATSAAQSSAPQTFSTLYTNSPLLLNAGHYHGGPYRFSFVGGLLDINGTPLSQGLPLQIRSEPKATLEAASVDLQNTMLALDEVQAAQMTVRSLSESVFAARNSLFNDLILFTPDPRSPGPVMRPSSIQFNNCALSGLQATNLFASVVRLAWENCAFYHSTLTPAWLHDSAFDDLSRSGSKITHCRFVNCVVSYDFLSVTEACDFEGCSLVPRPKSALGNFLGHPITVHLKWRGGDTLVKSAAPPGVTFEDQADIKDGCTINHVLGANGLTLAISGDAIELKDKIAPLSRPALNASLQSFPTQSPALSNNALPFPTGNSNPAPATSNPNGTFKSQISHVNGLLVTVTESGSKAGSASRMNATALPLPNTLTTVRFSQDVGSSMTAALHEVVKHIQLHHPTWPVMGYQVEISFEEKYSNKDGPSAAVACGLLLDSLLSGQENDLLLAVTGDMNADGEVQPIGGVSAKVHGAVNSHCKYFAVPMKNEVSVSDMLLMDGPASLIGVQVFGITKFEDATALAANEKSATLSAAIQEFDQVAQLLNRDPSQITAWLKNAHVQEKLREVLKSAPNHLSAKHLLLYAVGKSPTFLSLGGSLDGIDYGATALVDAIQSEAPEEDGRLKTDTAAENLTKLRHLRPLLDPRVQAYADAVIQFGEVARDAVLHPPLTKTGVKEASAKIRQAAARAGQEWKKLSSDPKILEELKI